MLTKVISKTGVAERLINPFGQHFWSRNYLPFCCTCFIDYLSAASVLLITLVNISGAGTTYLSTAPVLLITLVNIFGAGTTYLSAAPVLLITLVNISGAETTYLSAVPLLQKC
jgi:hypothetical protein